MTPKQKAKHLLTLFENAHSKKMSDYSKIYTPTAKLCALICVSQILGANPHTNPLNIEVKTNFKYWKEVQQEIENL
jgi:hypothetical protein